MHVFISRNKDGRLIADAVRPWGVTALHGSTARRGKDKGGAAALRSALKILNAGHLVAITPDGPRGPAEHVQPGAEALSRIAKCPLTPVGMAASGIRLPSWDRLILPIPFGRGFINPGPPLVKADAATLRDALLDANKDAETQYAQTRRTPIEILWAGIGTALAPALTVMTRTRLRRGKELPNRVRERMGLSPTLPYARPPLWIHAASVGETLCARPLLDALLATDPALPILFTTATVTGGAILAQHPAFGTRITHQFIPHDVPRWTKRFLDRWTPSGAVFVESELWPGIVTELSRRHIPIMVVNGRLSDRSARRWQRWQRFTRSLFSRLEWVAARGEEDAAHFKTLGVRKVYNHGDLKRDAAPLPYDHAEFLRLRDLIGERPVFVAASTHAGEEEIILQAAERARATRPDLLTILVPRHPNRGAELSKRFALPSRQNGQDPDAKMPVFMADTLGELGLFYRLASMCFVGHSLLPPGGGHNPFEPLRLGVPTATGPHMGNWREAVKQLSHSLHIVANTDSLAQWLVAVETFPTGPLPETRLVHALTTTILETLER
ncbi:3-deoxy-D-manno-octulosonic-acid transferase [Neokomagataea thailandica NBRC 106555]|nr:3-deoxy-D-manno-octulosonic-acid transferase [Neokomagataea thailandica NBRC 106555]